MNSLSTVDKAVEVLFHLHGEASPQGVSEVGRALGLSKSSVHRLLSSLGRRGLVERDERGRYRTGIGLVALGLGALASEPIVAAARPVLDDTAAAVGETCFLVGARAGGLVVLAKAEGTGFLRAAPQVGAGVPVHATAVGKLFLAHAPEGVSLPDAPFERYSEHTHTDAAALAAEVERARRRGYAENQGEWIPGMRVLAAPVFGGDRMLAAVAVAASTQGFDARGVEAVAEITVAASRRIAARLAGTGL